ncbi:MAG: undecaprenyl-diphosphate phosphatase [Candidatus Micrarchaeota archaeon]|nr:undecaprenyl-diphosphate phosphatase [Candidatus Micrarchaeota archaeon]
MDLPQILLLGLVQAITEWLPLSSKTMTAAAYMLFGGRPQDTVAVLLFLHLGTLAASVLYFRKEIANFIAHLQRGLANKKPEAMLAGRAGFFLSALFFTGIVGIPLLAIEWVVLPFLDGSSVLAVMGAGLIFTGFLITSHSSVKWREDRSANWKDGVITGLMQGLSVLPGVSRAGTTTAALIWRGFNSQSAFKLSFLLSIPVVLAAEVLIWGFSFGSAQLPIEEGAMLAASSFVFGYFTIGFLMYSVRKLKVEYLAFIFGILMLLAGIYGLG